MLKHNEYSRSWWNRLFKGELNNIGLETIPNQNYWYLNEKIIDTGNRFSTGHIVSGNQIWYYIHDNRLPCKQ